MRERLRVHGGDVETGRRPDGGFEVSAHLLQAGGFGAVRRAAETPLNLVLEARLP